VIVPASVKVGFYHSSTDCFFGRKVCVAAFDNLPLEFLGPEFPARIGRNGGKTSFCGPSNQQAFIGRFGLGADENINPAGSKMTGVSLRY
jgi:hypothetical protein